MRRDVTQEFVERIRATAYLATTGIILSMCIATPLGTLVALKCKTYVDNAVQILALAGIFIPDFLVHHNGGATLLAAYRLTTVVGIDQYFGEPARKPDLFDLACDRDRLPARRRYNAAD